MIPTVLFKFIYNLIYIKKTAKHYLLFIKYVQIIFMIKILFSNFYLFSHGSETIDGW